MIFLLSVTPIIILSLEVQGSLTIQSSNRIQINGNDQLKEMAEGKKWVGNGSELNPFQIKDVVIDMGSIDQWSHAGINIQNTDLFIIITDVLITNSMIDDPSYEFENFAEGIYIYDSENIEVINCDVDGYEYSGMTIHTSQNILVENTKFSPFESEWDQEAIKVYESNNSSILSNNIKKSSNGIGIVRSNHTLVNNNRIESSWEAINVQGNSQFVTITNNRLINGGLSVYDGYEHLNIENNQVNGHPLLFVNGTSDLDFTGDYGQIILINVKNVRIESVTIKNATLGLLIINATNINIHESTFFGNALFNLEIENVNDSIIDSNEFSSGRCGLYFVAPGVNNSITSNIFSDNEAGISFYDLSINPYLYSMEHLNNTISSNVFLDNQHYIKSEYYGGFEVLTYWNIFTNNTVIVNEYTIIFDGLTTVIAPFSTEEETNFMFPLLSFFVIALLFNRKLRN